MLSMLAQKNRSVSYLSQDDPFNLLIGFICLASVISSTYVFKIIENKYIRYPIVDEKSNLDVLENFGVSPKPIIPSSITLTLEYTNGLLPFHVEIPYNTRFHVLYDDFVTFDSFYLLPNSNYVTVTAYCGEIVEEEYSVGNIINQRILLFESNVAMDFVVVTVDGKKYTRTDNCLYKQGESIFSVDYGYDGKYYITFSIDYGDYVLDNSRINIRYLTSKGTINYDPTQETIKLVSPVYDDIGDNIGNYLEVYNIESFSYGDHRHTVNFCYKNLGRLLSTFGKAVTTEDYKILTDYYHGVAVSAAYDINSDRRMDPFIYIQIPYYTKVVVAPTENYYPTEYLKKELYDYYDKVGVDRNQVFIQIIDPRYRSVDVNVYISTKYLSPSEVLDSYNLVYRSISNFFAVGNLEFGSTITESTLLSIVIGSDTKLLYSNDIAFRDFDTVACEADELPILGRLNISYNYEKIKRKDLLGYIDDTSMSLLRYIPEEIVLEDSATYGPAPRDYIYISDEVYKDQNLATDITIIRYTNLVIHDYADATISSSIVEGTRFEVIVSDEVYAQSQVVRQIGEHRTWHIDDQVVCGNNLTVYKDGVEYRWLHLSDIYRYID